VGWPNPPSPETHLRLLGGSDHVALAINDETGRVVGFISAITDKVLFAYISLVEVLPDYRGRGIGSELVRQMMEKLGGFYAVDTVCDPEVVPFYAALGMETGTAMIIRRHELQSGV